MSDILTALTIGVPAISVYAIPVGRSTPDLAGSNEQSTSPARAISGPFYPSPSFTFDASTGVPVVRFRDRETGELRKQIPSEELLLRYRQGMVPVEAVLASVSA